MLELPAIVVESDEECTEEECDLPPSDGEEDNFEELEVGVLKNSFHWQLPNFRTGIRPRLFHRVWFAGRSTGLCPRRQQRHV